MSRRRRGIRDRLTAGLRLRWHQAVRSDEGSRFLAGGLALGVFIAAFPVSILHFPAAWILATLFRVSKVTTVAVTTLSNPLTIAPIFVFTTSIGLMVTPGGESSAMMHPIQLFEDPAVRASLNAHDITIVVVGSVVSGVAGGLVAYFLGLRWIAAARRQRSSYRKVSPQAASRGHDG